MKNKTNSSAENGTNYYQEDPAGKTERMLKSEDYIPTAEDMEYKGWKHLLPCRSSPKNLKTIPMIYSGLFSFSTSHWLNGFFYEAYKRRVTKDNIYETAWKDSADYNSQVFEDLWSDQLAKYGKSKASVTRAVINMVLDRFILASIFCIIMNVFAILRSVYFLQKILNLIQSPGDTLEEQIVYMIFLVLCSLGRTTIFNVCFTISNLAAIRARGGVLSLVFRKILYHRHPDATVGQLVNLCANDGQRIYDAITYSSFLFSLIPTIGAAVYSGFLLGVWGLVGFAIFFGFVPIQILLSRLVFKYRAKAIRITEERVKLMSEIVTAIKLVKMYAWEKPFSRKINDIRAREKVAIQLSLMTQSFLSSLPLVIPVVAAAFTFLVMTLTGTDISVTEAFVYISLLNALRFPLASMPYCLKSLAEGLNACRRLTALLTSDSPRTQLSEIQNEKNLVEIKNGVFGWEQQINTDLGKPKGPGKKNVQNGAHYGSIKHKKVTQTAPDKFKDSEKQPLINGASHSGDPSVVITLRNITMNLRERGLVGVCGAVGSGKTSLIQAILGMMKIEGGAMAVNTYRKIAYVPQQAWIMNATLKDNITFGKPFDQQWYDEVVEACALPSDFKQLPAGDQTEVGERGINLSGGQKQRISVARAVYSEADIILLDDPLSAVDALVGQHIFTNCIKDLLDDKTVLFVTHQLQFLPECDYVLVMKDGQIAEEGTHEKLMNYDGEYFNLIKSFHSSDEQTEANDLNQSDATIKEEELLEKEVNIPDFSADALDAVGMVTRDSLCEDGEEEPLPLHNDIHQKGEAQSGKLTKEENMEQDNVDLATLYSYVKAGGGLGVAFLVVVCIVLFLTSQAFNNYWLSLWTEDGSGGTYINQTITINGVKKTVSVLSQSIIDNPRIDFYQIVYGSSLLLVVVLSLVNAISFMLFCLRASTNIHDQVFRKLVASPMRFFDVTPSGQILNRFSKDLDEVDTMLPFVADQFFKNLGFILTSIILIIISFPLFTIGLLPLLIISYFLYRLSKIGMQLAKKIDNVTKSPLFSHIATSIQGLETIRAYKMERQFGNQFNKLSDHNNMALFLFDMTMRWTAVRFDVLCIFVVILTFTFISIVPKEVLSPSMAALSLTYALTIGDIIQVMVRFAVQTEARLTSVRRIINYIKNLESEAPAVVEHQRPDADWPEGGAIKFENVDVRYREGLPLVLKNISLDIQPREKIGIVGRTGSGKSSLTLILFRIMELAGGSISIDGIDISTIGLEDLRSKLSIIPQDPVLFVGTVRYNLDPFNIYSDKELWAALKKCHIKQTIKDLNGQLEAPVVENGENFSVGERQLLCMARALVRQSKILVLDEATAAIDTETDSLIQETIKEAFSDCTMLTIAHRLNTVVNYDRILVLDAGKAIEFDTPTALLANRNSVFSQMIAVQEDQKHAAITNGY